MAVTLRNARQVPATVQGESQSALMAVTLRNLTRFCSASLQVSIRAHGGDAAQRWTLAGDGVMVVSQSALMAVTLRNPHAARGVCGNVNPKSQSALMAVTLRNGLRRLAADDNPVSIRAHGGDAAQPLLGESGLGTVMSQSALMAVTLRNKHTCCGCLQSRVSIRALAVTLRNFPAAALSTCRTPNAVSIRAHGGDAAQHRRLADARACSLLSQSALMAVTLRNTSEKMGNLIGLSQSALMAVTLRNN